MRQQPRNRPFARNSTFRAMEENATGERRQGRMRRHTGRECEEEAEAVDGKEVGGGLKSPLARCLLAGKGGRDKRRRWGVEVRIVVGNEIHDIWCP